MRNGLLSLSLAGVTVACGGNGSGDSGYTESLDDDSGQSMDHESILSGTLIDGSVQGLNYRTLTQQGITNALGEYTYQLGDVITFSIGLMAFPSAMAAEVLTPFQLAKGSTNPVATTLNIAKQLRSLDNDGVFSNGIRIVEQATYSAYPINFDVSPNDFETDSAVIHLVANSGSITRELKHSTP